MQCNVMINSELILPKAMSYANSVDLTQYKFEEFHPHETCRIIAEIYYCPVHYPKFCRIVYPQYRYQYLCTASLNSSTNLLSNGELLKPNHRISIDHVTCGGVLTVSNPIGLQQYSC
ncbi:hypothetical protein Tsp_08422 [Trichinella spiralis]|uniref:hypothetical protein n=1 Tax=Trichinella spiralis TaxID=6334 RepID=UPI0001EFB57D|nr:hypothetical protein Tsp_08422 [Trichinella spiralis]